MVRTWSFEYSLILCIVDRSFVIMGVGWTCAGVFSVFGEEAGVVDMLGVAVCVVI